VSEPVDRIAEDARRNASHALLLTRIFASVATLVLGLPCLLAGPIAGKFGTMFAEMGGQLPVISRLIVELPTVWMSGVLVLVGVTLFFIWAKGRAAAWMAGLGLLCLAVALPVIVFAMFLPLVRIVSDMGSM
jgi:hypothetical protein